MRARNPVYRMGRVAGAVSRAIVRYEWLEVRESFDALRPSPEAWTRAHERSAESFYRLGVDLGGAFVKLCQVAGARADFLPAPFIQKLGRFHDRVPHRPFADLLPFVEQELGRAAAEVFDSVDPEPLAAASLAQVHRGRLRSGEDVAVKIQYPEAQRLFHIDIANVRRAARGAARLLPFDPRPLVDEVARFVRLELDFEREAQSTSRIAEAFSGDPTVRVPRVYPEISSGRLLVLEYVEGTKITEVERLRGAGVDLTAVCERVARIFCTMIFEHGFFHGDPHPGNLLVLPDGSIGLLDFGLARELPAGFASGVAKMIVRGVAGDAAGAAEAARAIGFEIDDADASLLPELVRTLLGENVGPGKLRNALGQPAAELHVPGELALVLRTMILLNGLSHTLAPGERLIPLAIARALAPYVAEPAG